MDQFRAYQGAVLMVYQLLLSYDKVTDWTKQAWEIEIGLQLSDKQWREINVMGTGDPVKLP